MGGHQLDVNQFGMYQLVFGVDPVYHPLFGDVNYAD